MGSILKGSTIEGSIIKPIRHFEEARKCHTAHYRLEAMRKAAVGFRDDMPAKPQARFYQSMGLIRVPYPTKYAFLNCNVVPDAPTDSWLEKIRPANRHGSDSERQYP
ncbi:hypothetical protein [uncultured Marinobacter sp.]|uniref:hypothetical protein n=1 Tax=uncultured Marinobacter sp. TaxID=187379 RepID=UPI002606D27F|nr:hypothetical protein [uncultured Marinobacter sp.]